MTTNDKVYKDKCSLTLEYENTETGGYEIKTTEASNSGYDHLTDWETEQMIEHLALRFGVSVRFNGR